MPTYPQVSTPKPHARSWPNLLPLSCESYNSRDHAKNNPFKVVLPSMGIIQSQIPQKKIGIGKKKSSRKIVQISHDLTRESDLRLG
jgi:hypothetical protein